MAADPTLADRTNDPNDPRWSLADAFDMGVERCRGNRDDTILMTYNGRTHNISTITVGQLRAAAVRLRKLDAIEEDRNVLLWVMVAAELDIGLWCENITHAEPCGCDDPDDPEALSDECKAVNEWRPALLDVDANHGDRLRGYLPEPAALAEFAERMEGWGYTPTARIADALGGTDG